MGSEMPTLELDDAFPLRDFVTEVSPNDGMFDTSHHYVGVGLSALTIIEYGLSHGLVEADRIETILDLPCGHGRVCRVLRSRFPSARLTVSDIDRDGVDFCAARFGAAGAYSVKDFEQLDFGQLFDLIWVGSLITHFNPDATANFIKCMERHLSQDGLLIISSHGKFAVELIKSEQFSYGLDGSLIPHLLNDYRILGYGYLDYPGMAGYGISIISRSWFEGFFAGTTLRLVGYLEREWDRHHDILLLKKRGATPSARQRPGGKRAKSSWKWWSTTS
jgi:SAM-dependent methyltransferase